MVRHMKVMVLGHRNPDTDAIVSAISFSYILRSLGYEAVAGRVGDIQPETRIVLEKTGLDVPELVEDVKPRVRDVMTPNPISVRLGEPVKKAIDILVSKAIRSVPIVDGDNKVYGLFSTESFARYFLNELISLRLTLREVPVRNFLEISNSRLVVGSSNSVLSGRVYVAAWSLQAIEKRLTEDIRGQILVVGDREDVQIKAIESGISALIVTGGFEVSPSVVEKAMKNNVKLIISPYDTYTTLRLLDLSQPVEYFAEKPRTVTEDSLVKDVARVMVNEGVRTVLVVDSIGRLRGIVTRRDLVRDYRKRVALVDHNEFSQSVEGIEESAVIAVVDHHRVSGDVKTLDPIIFRVEPLGSTNTIIWAMSRELGLSIPKNVAEAMLYAILSDTLLLKSPTTTAIDRAVANEIAEYVGLTLDQAIEFMRIAMAANEPSDPRVIVARDLKIFDVGGISFGIAQTFTTRVGNYISMVDRIKHAMDEVLREKGLRFLVLMITDYIEGNSLIIASGDIKTVEKALETDLSKGYALMQGVTSRKSQVLPKILRYIESMRI